jgi:hypothetical protein
MENLTKDGKDAHRWKTSPKILREYMHVREGERLINDKVLTK